jgi:pyrimidine operon attenuation protein/uracil phosphoribosyltransferase
MKRGTAMTEKKSLLSPDAMRRTIGQMADEIAEVFKDQPDVALVGIRRHGVTLARRIQAILEGRHGVEVPFGILDITMYRDDLAGRELQPIVRPTHLDFDVNDRVIVLVDDVLYTGRTIRCALDQLLDYGRPKLIRLAVLADRGHREMPIQADIVGLRVESLPEQRVEVDFVEVEGEDGVWVADKKRK